MHVHRLHRGGLPGRGRSQRTLAELGLAGHWSSAQRRSHQVRSHEWFLAPQGRRQRDDAAAVRFLAPPWRECLAFAVSGVHLRGEIPVQRLLVLLLSLGFALAAAARAAMPSHKQETTDEKTPAETAKKGSEEGGKSEPGLDAATPQDLSRRSIAPALTSSRIPDFAVDPAQRSHYFVTVSSGGE